MNQKHAPSLDHLIVLAHSKTESAAFLTDLLNLPAATPQSIFLSVRIADGTTLLFKEVTEAFPGQHYAFRLDGAGFEAALKRLQKRGTAYWASPHGTRVGEIYREAGVIGFYLQDPAGHQLELLTSLPVDERGAF